MDFSRPAQIRCCLRKYRIYASDMLTSYKVATEMLVLGLLANPSNPHNAYFNNTNWSDLVYQTGNVGSMLNVDGGDDRAMYYFLWSYFRRS